MYPNPTLREFLLLIYLSAITLIYQYRTEVNINLCKIYCTGHTFVLPYQEQDARRVYNSDNLTSTPALY